jgi:hypothetical protein
MAMHRAYSEVCNSPGTTAVSKCRMSLEPSTSSLYEAWTATWPRPIRRFQSRWTAWTSPSKSSSSCASLSVASQRPAHVRTSRTEGRSVPVRLASVRRARRRGARPSGRVSQSVTSGFNKGRSYGSRTPVRSGALWRTARRHHSHARATALIYQHASRDRERAIAAAVSARVETARGIRAGSVVDDQVR